MSEMGINFMAIIVTLTLNAFQDVALSKYARILLNVIKNAVATVNVVVLPVAVQKVFAHTMLFARASKLTAMYVMSILNA